MKMYHDIEIEKTYIKLKKNIAFFLAQYWWEIFKSEKKHN